jgi:hypothetical protein
MAKSSFGFESRGNGAPLSSFDLFANSDKPGPMVDASDSRAHTGPKEYS